MEKEDEYVCFIGDVKQMNTTDIASKSCDSNYTLFIHIHLTRIKIKDLLLLRDIVCEPSVIEKHV